MKRLAYPAVLLLLMATACGIEDFEILDPPNPPMGLTAWSTNSKIYVRFQAYNPEESFSGYNVYLGIDEPTVRSQTNPVYTISRTLPYYSCAPFHQLTIIQFEVSNDPQYPMFSPGTPVFVGVAAYDSLNRRASKTSDITNIMIYGGE